MNHSGRIQMPARRIKRNLAILFFVLWMLVTVGVPLCVEYIAEGDVPDLGTIVANALWANVVAMPVMLLIIGFPSLMIAVFSRLARKQGTAHESDEKTGANRSIEIR